MKREEGRGKRVKKMKESILKTKSYDFGRYRNLGVTLKSHIETTKVEQDCHSEAFSIPEATSHSLDSLDS